MRQAGFIYYLVDFLVMSIIFGAVMFLIDHFLYTTGTVWTYILQGICFGLLMTCWHFYNHTRRKKDEEAEDDDDDILL